jgi:hypothetical protein
MYLGGLIFLRPLFRLRDLAMFREYGISEVNIIEAVLRVRLCDCQLWRSLDLAVIGDRLWIE